jgi:hypothetical protein
MRLLKKQYSLRVKKSESSNVRVSIMSLRELFGRSGYPNSSWRLKAEMVHFPVDRPALWRGMVAKA